MLDDAPSTAAQRVAFRHYMEHGGAWLGFHIAGWMDYQSPGEVLRAISGLSKTMGATSDTGQFAFCGYDPADAVRKLAPRLRMVHLKDVKAKGSDVNVLLGDGIARVPAVMHELHRQSFAGLVAVEYEKEGPVDQDMAKEIAYCEEPRVTAARIGPLGGDPQCEDYFR